MDHQINAAITDVKAATPTAPMDESRAMTFPHTHTHTHTHIWAVYFFNSILGFLFTHTHTHTHAKYYFITSVSSLLDLLIML